jgi:putative redox protein
MTVSARRRKGYAHILTAGHHTLIADEPESAGGADTGPTPQQLFALSLASCTAITIEMYGERKDWKLDELAVDVDYELDAKGGCSRFDVVIRAPAELSDEQRDRLRTIAGKCPVHRALVGQVEIADRIENI